MKRIMAMVVLCLTVISLSGCNVEVNRNAIYDDDKEIAKSADSHYANTSVYGLDDNELSMTARSFTGAKTVWRYTAKTDEDVTFSYELAVNEGGKAKLVLITPGNEVITLIENNENIGVEETQSQTVSLMKGNNRIKIVGQDDPSFSLVLSVDAGELIDK